MERNHALLNLQYELLEHENCAFIIEKQKMDIEKLKQQEEDYQKQMELLSFKISELNCQISSSSIKIEEPKVNTTYVTEVKVNLEQDAGDAVCVKPEDTFILSELKEKIRALQTEMESVVSKNTILEQDNENLERILNCYKEKTVEHDSLRVELEETSRLLGELRGEIQAIASENCSLKETVCALEDTIKVLTTSKMKLLKEMDGLKQTIEDVKQEKRKVEGVLEVTTASCEELKDIVEKTEMELLELQKRIEELKSEVQCKNEAIAKLEKDLTDDIDLRIQLKRTYEKEISFKENEIEHLSSSFKNQKDINNNLLRNLNLLEDEIKNKNTMITELQSMKKSELDFYNQNTNLLKDLNMKLQESVSEKLREIKMLQSKCSELQVKNNRDAEELKALQEEYKFYKDITKHNSNTESMVDDSTHFEALKSEIEQIKKEKLELQNKLATVEIEKQSLIKQKETNASLFRTLHNKSLSARVAVEEFEHLTDLDLLKKVKQLEQKNELLLAENVNLVSENGGLKEKLEQLQATVDKNSELADLKQALQKTETSSELSDDTTRDKKDKEMLSFSKMQIKVERLQGKVEDLQELLDDEKRKNEELRLQNETAVKMFHARSENEKMKSDELQLKLKEAEHEVTRLKAKQIPDLKEIVDTVSDINDLRFVLHESNVRLVSVLEEMTASEKSTQR